MKRLYYFLIIFSLGVVTPSFSQTSSCTQALRLIRSTYEQGRLHELPALAGPCLSAADGKGFTKEEKREAYRFLTLAYIYLEEPEKADESMLKLLETDHFFEVNKSLDPAEFIALYNKFRTKPLFRIGFKFGVNVTQPTVLNYFDIGSTGGGHGTFSMNPSFQFFAVFEKDISNKLVIAPEIGMVLRSFQYDNDNLGVADEDPTKPVSSQKFIINQTWMDLNGIVHYNLKNTLNLKTWVGGGPGISYLLSSGNQASTKLGNGFTVTGGEVKDKGSYNSLIYSFTVAAGGKIKFGDVYVTADIRYQYGMVNVINSSSRTNPILAYDYQGQYDDYRMSNLMINIGVVYPYFKPKKLIK